MVFIKITICVVVFLARGQYMWCQTTVKKWQGHISEQGEGKDKKRLRNYQENMGCSSSIFVSKMNNV